MSLPDLASPLNLILFVQIDHILVVGHPHQRKHPANTALPSDPISLNLVPT